MLVMSREASTLPAAQVAVYKDDAGKVHAYSALCPHMVRSLLHAVLLIH